MAQESFPKLEGLLSESEQTSKYVSWALYPGETKDKSISVYGEDAQQYEDLNNKLDYLAHSTGVKILVNHIEKIFSKDCNILDLGAGTGMCGDLLKKCGYTNMTAVDYCEEMLEEARKKNIYNSLVQKDINEDSLEEFDGLFDAVICMGLFYPGQVGSSALAKILKVIKPDGLICFSIRTSVYDKEESEYKKMCDFLVKEGKWKQLSSETNTLFGKIDVMAYFFTFQRTV